MGGGAPHVHRLFPAGNGNPPPIRPGGRSVLPAPHPLGRTVRTVGQQDPVRNRAREKSQDQRAIFPPSPVFALGERGVTMISIFTRQAVLVRQGAYGQAAVLLLTTLTAVLSVVFAAVYVAHLGVEKIASANAVDAIALSAATWEARGLNMIAAFNDGIQQCFRLIRWTCVLWAAMAIAACTGLGLPAFLEYSKRAARIIRSSWNTAPQAAVRSPAPRSDPIRPRSPCSSRKNIFPIAKRSGSPGSDPLPRYPFPFFLPHRTAGFCSRPPRNLTEGGQRKCPGNRDSRNAAGREGEG